MATPNESSRRALPQAGRSLKVTLRPLNGRLVIHAARRQLSIHSDKIKLAGRISDRMRAGPQLSGGFLILNCVLPVRLTPSNSARPSDLASRCVECGLCVSVCPTNVFRTSSASDEQILNAAKSYAQVEFACSRKQERDSTNAPGVEGILSVSCLARLSPELLAALGSEHATVWLDDLPCAGCAIGKRTRPHILAARDEANQLLTAWDRGDTVHCHTDARKPGSAARRVPLLRETSPVQSRRELFSFLARQMAASAVETVAAPLPGFEAPTEPIGIQLPSARITLLSALTNLGAPRSACVESTRLASVQVGEACTACGLCAKICPRQALYFQIESDQYTLTARPRLCLGAACSLCRVMCPADALTISTGARREDLLQTNR